MLPAIHCREIASGRCHHCGRLVLFSRRLDLPEHRFHALASLLTGGLWIAGWIACWLRSAESMWECQECGGRLSTGDLYDVRPPVVHEFDFGDSRCGGVATDDELPGGALAAQSELETWPIAGQVRP